MALATLSIDLVAQLANLQQGLDKAGRMAEKNAAQIQARYDVAAKAAAGIGAALAASLSVAGITAFVRSTVDGVDKLNDLSDATGASIENLSALEDIAARTGTSVDTVGDSVVKLNKVLSDAKPDSDASRALKALGLDTEELKRLDPAEALRNVAVALSKFADDGSKARIVQELFGKSVREVAPFLKDLAEAGQLNATVTTEQAKAAEAFNQQLFRLQKNIQDLARSAVGPLVDALLQVSDAFADVDTHAGELKGTAAVLAVPLQALTVLGANVAFVFRGIGVEIGGIAAQAAALARLDFAGAGAIGDAMKQDAEAARARLDEFERRVLGLDGAANDALRRSEDRGFTPTTGSVDVAIGKDDAKKRLDEYLKLVSAQAAGEEQAAKDSAEAWQAWEAIQLKDHKESTDAWALQWKQVFDEIDAEQERAIEEGAALIASQVEQISEFAQQAARNIQDALGDTVLHVLDGKFDSIGQLWLDLLKRMAAQAAAAQLGEALFGSDFAKTGKVGGSIGDLFKWFGSMGSSGSGGSGYEFDIGTWDGSHANGLDYVPFDGYRAILHKGESVRTAAETASDAQPRPNQQFVVNNYGEVSQTTQRYVVAALAQFRAQMMRGN